MVEPTNPFPRRGLFLIEGRSEEEPVSRMISAQALREELRNGRRPQLIDVRTASEFAGGHIPCSINIPMDQMESRRPDLRLEDEVVLICKAGSRAQIAR